MSIKLRPYQIEALENLRNEFRKGKKRVILYSPTGSGKTEMGMEMIKMARQKNTRVVFLANRIGLVEQASARFYKSGIEHGIIQSKNTRRPDAGVIVASIQTIARRGMPETGLFVIDEAHACAGSKAYRDIMMQYPEAPVIGLSATPFSPGLGKMYPNFGNLFQSIAMSATIGDLIEQGYLVDVDIWAPSQPDLTGVRIVAGDYDENQLADAVDKPNLIGDIVAHWKRLAGNRQTVCFAINIPHSKHIADQFNGAGIRCEHIDCYTKEDDRKKILENVNTGKTKVVTNCAVLAEGWDQPSVEVMICARPTKSLIRWIQMSGRILRPFEGKERALILDHSGTSAELGYPTDDLPLELDDGKPRKSAEREREDPKPKICIKCQFMKPAGIHICPKCGFAPEKQSTVEVGDGRLQKMERSKLKKMTVPEKQKLYAELLGYARNRGYKDGWAYFACQEIAGSAPRDRFEAMEPSPETEKLIVHMNIKRAKRREAEKRNAEGVYQ